MSLILATDVPFAYYEHDEYCLYYDKENNLFIDEDGAIVCNIFRFVSPNNLYMFKARREDMYLYDEFGKSINLIWDN